MLIKPFELVSLMFMPKRSMWNCPASQWTDGSSFMGAAVAGADAILPGRYQYVEEYIYGNFKVKNNLQAVETAGVSFIPK